MTDPSGPPAAGQGPSFEQRMAEAAAGLQRWMIRTSARNMRDEMSGQMRRALRRQQPSGDAVWNKATTEDPSGADEPPECSWCPVCRAARALARAREESAARARPRPGGRTGGSGTAAGGASGSEADPWSRAAGSSSAGHPAQDGGAPGRGQGPQAGGLARGTPAGPAQPRAGTTSAPQALAAVVSDAVSEAVRLIDSLLSYRPPEPARGSGPAAARPAAPAEQPPGGGAAGQEPAGPAGVEQAAGTAGAEPGGEAGAEQGGEAGKEQGGEADEPDHRR